MKKGVLERALSQSARLTKAVVPGKQALQNRDRSRIEESGAEVTDSLSLDREFKAEQPNRPRWDYLVGVRVRKLRMECVCAVEVHHATPGEVELIVKKKRQAEETLQREGVGSPVDHWVWIASSSVGISKTTREFRILLKERIDLVRHWVVRDC